MADALLAVEALETGYGEVQVLWGISLELSLRKVATYHRCQSRR